MNRIIALLALLAVTLTLTACENVTVTWAPTELQEEIEQTADCHVGVEPQERGSVIFQMINCDIRTIAELQLGNGDILTLTGPYRQVWAPNPRRVQYEYFVRARYIEGQRFSTSNPRVIIGHLHYRW